jgi:hypothetical protein
VLKRLSRIFDRIACDRAVDEQSNHRERRLSPLRQRSGSDINLSHGRSYVHPNVNSAIVCIEDLNVSNENAGFATLTLFGPSR